MTTTTDIDKLAQQMREAAGKATPGPWRQQTIEDEGDDCGRAYIVGANLEGLVGAALPWPTELETGDFTRVEANAKFMEAANPAAVLALLDDRERLVAEAAAAKATMEMAATSGAFWARRAENAETALSAKEQECERLRKLIVWAYDTLGEINPSNYDHEDVCRLNDQSVEVILGLKEDALATSGGGNG